MTDKWAKAREKHQKNLFNGTSPYYNFDYKSLFEKFNDLNHNLIEAEEGRVELEDCIKENDFCTRVFRGQSYYQLEKLKKEAQTMGLKSRGYKSLRDLSGISYADLLKIIFYGRLTELKRAKANWTNNIGGIFKIETNCGQFNLCLENPEIWIENEEKIWINNHINIDYALVLGEI